MSVVAETPIASSVANGVTTVFPYSFTVLAAADLKVKGELSGVVTSYTLGVDYTLSGVGTGSGSVNFLAAPANGTVITRYRDTELTRPTDYQDNGDLLAGVLNGDLDRLWLVLQEIYAGGKGAPTSLRVPNGETVPALPAAASRANRVSAFDSNGDPITIPGVDAGSAAALAIDLANSASSTKGPAQVAFNYALNYAANTIGWAAQVQLISVKWFGAKGDGVTDDTAAIQAAIDFVPKFGVTGWRTGGIFFPTPSVSYKVTSALKVLGRQGYVMKGDGASITGNFAGYLLEVGDGTDPNDCLWTTIEGLEFLQSSTAAGSGAVKAVHNYTCRYVNCRFYGGEYAFHLDGNANIISGCSFRAATLANVKTGAQSNNETNLFLECSNEVGAQYGYDLSVAADVGGFTQILGGYCEANGVANIYATNACKVIVEGVYFNLQNGMDGVRLGGSVGANYAEPYVRVSDCRIEGPVSGTPPKFINELSATSINAAYENNTVRAGLCDLYGSAGKSINLRRRRDRSYLSNADVFSGGGPGAPTGWTLVGAGPFATSASISPYGSGAAAQVSGASYIHQLVKFPANALLRISVYGLTTGTDATVELRDAALAAVYTGASASATTGTATRLEFFVPPSARASSTSGRLLLRNIAGVNNAYFDNIVIEDMTN